MINSLIKPIVLSIIFTTLFLVGCDRFHRASLIVDPKILKSEVGVTDKVIEQKIISAVKEFSSKFNFDCRPIFQPPDILECGPAWHRKITLYRKDNKYMITLFEMHPGWGGSPFFCEVQDQMFEYFPQKFGESNVTVETNDTCGRKNYH